MVNSMDHTIRPICQSSQDRKSFHNYALHTQNVAPISQTTRHPHVRKYYRHNTNVKRDGLQQMNTDSNNRSLIRKQKTHAQHGID